MTDAFIFRGTSMEMDTLDVRSEQVVYLPEDRVLVFPVEATVTHPSGGVSGDRGRWSMEPGRGWFAGVADAPARFRDGDLAVAADSLVMGDTLGLAVGRVVIRDTSGQYRLRADTAHFGPLSATGDSSTTMRLRGQALRLAPRWGGPLWMCGGGAGHRTRPAGRQLRALEGAALHFGEVTAAAVASRLG